MGRHDLDGYHVVIMGGYDEAHPREKSLSEGFEHAGATVSDCRYRESVLFIGPRKLLLLPYIYWSLIRTMADLIDRTDHIDVILVTRFDPLVLPLAAVYAWRLDARLVYDLYVSLYRTAAMRGIAWPFVKATYAIERLTYRLPDIHLVGTNQFIDLYADLYRLPPDRIARIPPGADEDRFYPRDVEKREPFTALYWGNFLPHHGVNVIVEAARDLRDEPIELVFLGTGPEEAAARERAATLGLDNVSFEGFVTDSELHDWIATSHVCLGVFSTDQRARASLTNKVCEAVASGKATLTEDSPAIREWFTPGESIYVVPPGDTSALARAILELRDDPSLVERLEAGGLAVHQREFSPARIAELLAELLAAEKRHDSTEP